MKMSITREFIVYRVKLRLSYLLGNEYAINIFVLILISFNQFYPRSKESGSHDFDQVFQLISE